ncbi:MAG TPA: serine/threonine protein kinase, partial [Deltaproteobacteria bacterium]|nr:serine/threonine protein kinase [Deltaproteobacteria bacterium]
MDTFEQRSVELLSLLGQGGFGKVYRGRVSVPGGFVRDMAIKVLHPEMATPAILARLRDEARTLLLLRDRAIVSAETPIQLGERWAVLMEYVDGMSAQEVLQELGPFPPSVAVEIVGEIARALDAAYHQEGPDGPLRLVHRDIKCANLQITRTGEVKILDFGVAVAEFDEREAKTRSMMLIGTPGYLAPERFSGIAGPESDVYALGISLFEMLAGRRPTQQEACPVSDPSPALEVACALATQMRAPDPADRPTAREVCARCREIVMSLQEISLTEWSRTIPARDSQADDQVGQMFSVSSHLALDQVGDPSGIEDPPTAAVSTIQGGRGPSPGWVGLLIGATIALLSAGIGLALVSVGGVALLMGPGLWDPEGEGLAVVADEVPGGAGPDPSGAVGASTSPLSTGGIAPGPGGDGGAAPGVAPPSPTAGADTVGVDAGTASAAEESAAGE